MSNQPFEGFDIPNTTPVPDIVFDELLGNLTGNELKVLLYIIRRTYGFGKSADAISLSQFREGITKQDDKILDHGCGINHNRTILVALQSLERKGYILSVKRNTKAGDSDTTIYKLHFKQSSQTASKEPPRQVVATPGNEVVTSGNDGSYPTSPRSLPQVTTVVTPGNTQETDSQETDSQERENPIPPPSPAPTPPVFPSQDDVPTDTFPEDGIPDEQEEEDEGPSTDKRPALRLVPPLHTQLPDKKAQVPERPWGTAACLLLFQEWRGYPLMAPAQKKEASECAHNLAASCSREEVIEVRTYMVEKHDHWRERASSVDVCQVATWFGEMVKEMKLYPEGRTVAKRNGGNGHAPPGTPRTPQSPKLTPLTGKPVPPPPGMLAKAQAGQGSQERESRQHGT